jgi:hypothetical protein
MIEPVHVHDQCMKVDQLFAIHLAEPIDYFGENMLVLSGNPLPFQAITIRHLGVEFFEGIIQF